MTTRQLVSSSHSGTLPHDPLRQADMVALFEELDWQPTPMGEISLRRRHDLTTGTDVYEVLLGEEYLMSSLFTVAERELATRALALLDGAVASDRPALRVLIGGLGLGYTARAALDDLRVGDVTVVEASEPVLDWHRRGLLPEARGLVTDPRCTLMHDDFFGLVAADPHQRFDAILLDIDHTPLHVLHPSHSAFYTVTGLRGLAAHLADGGVFALWSDDPPDKSFLSVLAEVFAETSAPEVAFANPLTGGESSNTVYLAQGVRAVSA